MASKCGKGKNEARKGVEGERVGGDEDGDIKGQFLDLEYLSTTRSEIPLNQQNKNVMRAVCCVSISFGGAEGVPPFSCSVLGGRI